MELTTPRLRLCPMDVEAMQALLDGRNANGLRWAEGYPLEGTLLVVAMQLDLVRRGIDRGPFGHFQIVVAGDEVVIGGITFHAPPDELGEVSVGFGIVPAARGRGYAREALRGVLDWALARPEVRCVQADTHVTNVAAQRVLMAAGMRLARDEGDRRLYEIHAG